MSRSARRPADVEVVADGLSVTMAMAVRAMEDGPVKASSLKENTLSALCKAGITEVLERVDGAKMVQLTQPFGRAVITHLMRWKKPCYRDAP